MLLEHYKTQTGHSGTPLIFVQCTPIPFLHTNLQQVVTFNELIAETFETIASAIYFQASLLYAQ